MVDSSQPQLIQLKFRDEPWKLLVACILLNRTQRKQVDRVIDDLFRDYPTPEDLADAREGELRDLLYPLGMSRTRAKRLIEFATAWLAMPEGLTGDDFVFVLSTLPGVGAYALDSYRLFVLDDLSVRPADKELTRWLDWLRRDRNYTDNTRE